MALRSILFGVSIFLVLLIFTEMILFVFPTMGSYKREMDHEAAFVKALVGDEYTYYILSRTKEVYYSTPEEIRHEQFESEYRNILIQLIDDNFHAARKILVDCRKSASMKNVIICFYDEEYDRYVFVIDGNEKEKAFLPGQWVSSENGAIDGQKTVNWNIASRWFMPIDYGKGWGWTATDYYPIKDDQGNAIGYVTLSASINDFARQIGWILAINIPFLLVIVLIFSYLASSYLYRRVIYPINLLAESAREYGNNQGEELRDDDVFSRLYIETGDEIEELWETMVNMEKEISTAMKQIVEATAKEERLQTELDFARNIQRAALPADFPAFPDRDEFEIFASMNPAKEVGGDFYDFFLVDDDHLCIIIADVSGKGVPAALFMMTCKSLLKSTTLHGGTPAEIMTYVNRRLFEENTQDMFITIWLGILDIPKGEITACSAGHEYPFVTDNEGNYNIFYEPHGVVCGFFEDVQYEDYSFTLPEDGKIFLYTDGVAEAQNSKEELFGFKRIGKSLNKFKNTKPSELIEGMKNELTEYAEGTEQFDDITMLSLWLKQ